VIEEIKAELELQKENNACIMSELQNNVSVET